MSLGQPKTTKFSIGTAELRVGPLNLANKLTQVHSVGLVDAVTVTVTQESVDLEGGFPKRVIDTAIVKQTAEMKATLREYSRRNMRIMLGDGLAGVEPADISTTLAVASPIADPVIDVVSSTGMVAGDFLVIFPDGLPEKVSVVKIASILVNAITLDTDTPTLHPYGIGDIVYVAHQVAIGAIAETNYFAAQVVQRENTSGRPVIFNFWKSSIASGLEYGTNASDFASTELSLKMLEPAACEYDIGGELVHLANVIPSHPIGMFITGADDSGC